MNDFNNYFKSRSFSDDIVKEWRLEDYPNQKIAKINYYDVSNNFLYPRCNNYGEKYKDKVPKYVSPKSEKIPGGHSWLYGLWKIKDLIDIEELLLAEGEYNCISAGLWVILL